MGFGCESFQARAQVYSAVEVRVKMDVIGRPQDLDYCDEFGDVSDQMLIECLSASISRCQRSYLILQCHSFLYAQMDY